MDKSYIIGSNPFFEFAHKIYSQVIVIDRMQKDNILEHINTLNFDDVLSVWDFIQEHLENVNICFNFYNLNPYAFPAQSKPTSKFDFILKNNQKLGAYNSAKIVNDFSYFVDSKNEAITQVNTLKNEYFNYLHKASVFAFIENKAELSDNESRKTLFIAFLTMLHKLYLGLFDTKFNEIKLEIDPYLFIPVAYKRLEVESVTFNRSERRTRSVPYQHAVYVKKKMLWHYYDVFSHYETRYRTEEYTHTWQDTYTYLKEVEYMTEYNKDRLENETLDNETYKIKRFRKLESGELEYYWEDNLGNPTEAPS